MAATVLLVDDCSLVGEALRDVLSAAGYHVIGASGAREALASLLLEPVHVAIVDMQLQGESGVRLLCNIRELYPEMKTVLMSGFFDQDEPAPRQLVNVADAVLSKPVDSSELRETLRRLLE